MHNDSLQADQLLVELDALEKLLTAHHSRTGLTALCRLVPSNAHWMELLHQHKLDQWLALPLDPDNFPALAHLQTRLKTLNFQKNHDSLTGLPNRRAFDRTLALEIVRATRGKAPLSLALIDLDNFKSINDSHGHPCGDRILQKMASILLGETRKIDTPARIGGEEFALLLPGTGLLRAQKLLERLLNTVRRAQIIYDSMVVTFTCSIGVASYRGKTTPNSVKLMAEADKALYTAKKTGKNRLEAAPLLDLGQESDQTLVQYEEKRFLFASFHSSMTDKKHKDA